MKGLFFKVIVPLVVAGITICGVLARGNAEQWEKFYAEARSLYDQGQYAEALEAASRSLQKAEGWLGLAATYKAESLNLIALSLDEAERYEEAEAAYRRALELEGGSRGRADNPDYATFLNNFAMSCNEQGRTEEAVTLAAEALEIWETLGSVRRVYALTTLASSLSSLEAYEQAADYAQRAVQVLDAQWPEQENLLVNALHWQGDACYALGRYEEAEAVLQRALELAFEAAVDTVVALTGCLVDAHLAQDQIELAQRVYLQTVAFLEQLPRQGADAVAEDGTVDWSHPDIQLSNALTSFGNFYLSVGGYEAAAEQYQQACELDARLYGPHHYYVVGGLNDLGFAHGQGGNYTQAQEAYLAALAILEQWPQGDSDVEFTLLQNLADVYEKSGQLQKSAQTKTRMYALVAAADAQPVLTPAEAIPAETGMAETDGAEAGGATPALPAAQSGAE